MEVRDPIDIIFNNANNVAPEADQSYQLSYQLPTTFNAKNMEVCLSTGYIFNSLFNISQTLYGNNSYTYNYPNGTGGFNTYSVNMPDGSYDIDIGLNGFLQSAMFLNDNYLINPAGYPVFFLSMNVNIIYLNVTVTSTPVPSSLTGAYAGWTLPAGALALPPVPTGPQIFTTGSNFGSLVGFDQNVYVPTVSPDDPTIPHVYSVLVNQNSTLIPELDPQYAFNVTFNGCNQPFVNSLVPSSIFQFTFTVSAGDQQTLNPYQYKWYKMLDNQYDFLTITITDQQNKPAYLNDPDLQITLTIRQKVPLNQVKI